MATLTLDRLHGTILEYGRDLKRYVRMGFAKELTVTPGQEYETIWQVLSIANCPQLGEGFPGHAGLLLRNILIYPLSATTARVEFHYQNPDPNGVTPTAYVITEDTHVVEYETDLVPGTREPIRTGDWTNADNANHIVRGDNVVMRFSRSHGVVAVSALRTGSPSTSYHDYVNTVNNGPWYGKPAGYWKLLRWRTDISKYSGYYQMEAAAVSRVDEDWSEFGILVDQRTGKKIEVADAELTAALAPGYSQGIIYSGEGIVRVGAYFTSSFPFVFGF